jgi:N,N'-diacetyllegionaminate synthase
MLHKIAGRAVGADAPVFVIAEIGLNHSGSVDRALALVDAAAWAGASAIKLQSLFADRLVASTCPAPAHVNATSLREFFAQFELSLAAHREVVDHARAQGLAVITTPFAEDIIPALEEIGFDAYKIASGDLTYDGLIAGVAATKKPLVMSTGMSNVSEIRHALAVAARAGNDAVAVLHCVSAYPAIGAAQNLKAVKSLADIFQLPTGLSDHGSGLASAVAAATLGASIYERHLVLDGDMEAIDRAVSSTPAELRAIVTAMQEARVALGSGAKVCQSAEAVNVAASRRGLYTIRAMRAGETVRREDVAVLRPLSGLAPSQIDALIGVTLTRDIAAGAAFEASDLGAEIRKIA